MAALIETVRPFPPESRFVLCSPNKERMVEFRACTDSKWMVEVQWPDNCITHLNIRNARTLWQTLRSQGYTVAPATTPA